MKCISFFRYCWGELASWIARYLPVNSLPPSSSPGGLSIAVLVTRERQRFLGCVEAVRSDVPQ